MLGSIWSAVIVALWIMLLVQGMLLVVLGRHMRRLHQDLSPDASALGPAMGAEVPAEALSDVTGALLPLRGPAASRALLVFLSPGCSGCRSAIRDLRGLGSSDGRVVLLWRGDRRKIQALTEEYQIILPTVADEDGQLWEKFQISGVPFAIAVDADGRVAAKGFAHRAGQFAALLAAGADVPGPRETDAPPAMQAPAAGTAVR